MKCVICGQPATKILKCGYCKMLAAYICNGFVCQPEIWRTTGSVVPLMNMECEACGQGLQENPFIRRRFVGPPRPVFATTLPCVAEYFNRKKIVLITNVFGDGLGDMGQGLKLAALLHDLGAEVHFYPCCLTKDEEAVRSLLGSGTPWVTTVKSTSKQKFNEYNPVPVIDMDVYKDDGEIRKRIDEADLVIAFPTSPPIGYYKEIKPKEVRIEECVQTGENILGFGMSGSPYQNRARLGVLLCNMGPIDQWNLANLENQQLKSIILGGMDREKWRVKTVFSVGYLKMPEKSPNPFLSLGEQPSSMKMGIGPTRMHGPTGVMKMPYMHMASKSIGPLMAKKVSPVGIVHPSVNLFLDNYVKLMCISESEGKTVSLYCPNFDPGASKLGLTLDGAIGGFRRYSGKVFGKTLVLVCGNCSQSDFHKLLNEAALSGEIHGRPILVGATGEGSLSEVLSIESVTQAVFPIYSPRYPYQRDNLRRMSEDLADLFTVIMSLDQLRDEQITALWEKMIEQKAEMRNAQRRVVEEWNFLNRFYWRLKGKL